MRQPSGMKPVRITMIGIAVALAVSLPAPSSVAAEVEQQTAGTDLRREVGGHPDAPLISFIDSPTATCHLDMNGYDTCYVEWDYLYVVAGGAQYITQMTVELDGRKRAYYSGFFQTDMYVPHDLNGRGLRVACGELGAGGDPDLGNAYSYVIRATETGGLQSANYGTVYCPAMLPWQGTFEDGFESGDTSAWSSAVR